MPAEFCIHLYIHALGDNLIAIHVDEDLRNRRQDM